MCLYKRIHLPIRLCFLSYHSLSLSLSFLSNGHRQRERKRERIRRMVSKRTHALKIGGAHETKSNLNYHSHTYVHADHITTHITLSLSLTHRHTLSLSLSLSLSRLVLWVTSGRIVKWSMCVSELKLKVHWPGHIGHGCCAQLNSTTTYRPQP